MTASGSGKAYVSVNKALVTQASSAIPVVPLYVSILYKIMQEMGTRMKAASNRPADFLKTGFMEGEIALDSENRIRLDDWEMDPGCRKKLKSGQV